MVRGPLERPGLARTDLVAELYERNAEAQQAEAARAREAQQAERAQRRRARRRTVISSVAVILLLGALGVAGKLAYDAHRVGNAMELAQGHVHEGTPEALSMAATSLERAMEIDPGDGEVRATLALVRAQQAIDGAAPLDSVDAVLADGGSSAEIAVATAIAAALRGDYEAAAQAIDGVQAAGVNEAALHRAIAWVRAQVALHDLDDESGLAPALAAVEAALAEAPGWDRNYRSAAALQFRAGRTDQALELITKGRELRATDAGLSVDEALYHAVLQRELDSVETVTTQLLATPLSEADAARARLARAIARYYDDPDDDARSALAEAHAGLPARDREARALALEVALGSGAVELAKAWVEDGSLPPTTTEIHRAWIDYADDRVVESLEALAELPQEHPRVALVQGLALVEQSRFAEARTWLSRAQEAFPHRPFLEVATARVDAQLGEPGPAVERLEALAKDHPRTPRVWTGIAEAQVAGREDGEVPPSAEPALAKALEREAHPALAEHLMGRRLQAVAVDEPKRVPEALEHLRKAVELRGWVPAYRETLGLYLADVGDRKEARELLASTADAATTQGSSLLRLAELAAEQAVAQGEAPPAEIATWLALAAQHGAPPNLQAHTNARIALTARTPEGVAQARAWVEPLLRSDPADLEARLILIDVLRRVGDLDGARSEVRQGLRKAERSKEGRLHVVMARIELDAGKPRQAPSHAYKGWTLVADEPRPANELLEVAALGIDAWSAIKNDKVPLSIGKGLTRRVPYRAEAWILRANAQRKEEPDKACISADKAIALDDTRADAYLARAECKIALREHEAAADALEAAAERSTDEARQRALRRRARKLR